MNENIVLKITLLNEYLVFDLFQDGYQQNFKRGSGQSGPRGAPRGNIQMMNF